MSKSGRPSRPHTARQWTANTPRGLLPTTAGGGDTVPIDLDEELQTVLRKQYDDGEDGKKEAIHDMKEVLHQVAQDPMAQQMNKLLPTFLAPPKSAGPTIEDVASPRAKTSRSKSKPRATPRHAKLTARPSTAGGKSGYRAAEERFSVPNIPQNEVDHNGTMRIVTSAPTIPESRYSTATSSVPAPTSSSSSSKRMSRSSKTLDSTTTSIDKRQHSHRRSQDGESALSTTTTPATAEGIPAHNDSQAPERSLPFTENLLDIVSDSEEAEEIWKSDIVELTRIKSAPKGKFYGGPDSLELKYKDPIWPHQLFLNQILTRFPSLAHLVLDGSELRFLRDLGSSLQSLITLSICECGLRSLDGIYGMPNLRTLIARKNMISIPTQLSFLRKLCYVDLSSNPISSADEFGSLRHCGELRILKLYDTPLAIDRSNFNKEIKRLVPQLKEIHPSRLYDLIGMPKLMARSSKIMSKDRTRDYQKKKPGQNQKQQQMWDESKQVGAAMVDTGERNNKEEKSRRNDLSMMPSLAYDDVMVDQPKPGIAYQKIKTSKTLKEQEQEHRQKQSEIKDVSLGTGDFTGIFMAPKFLQHLEEAMPPSTAEDEDEENVKHEQQEQHESHHYPHESFGVAGANSHQDEKLFQEGSETTRNILRKKSDTDGGLLSEKQHSGKNHPRGDGDPGFY